MQAIWVNVWKSLEIDCQVPLISILEINTFNFEPILQGCKSWLTVGLQMVESPGCPSGCISQAMLTHRAGCKQPLYLCWVTARFLGLRLCVVNSEFTSLHLKDFSFHPCSYPQRTWWVWAPLAECLALCEHSVLAIGGIISIHHHYEHRTDSLKLLYIFPWRLFDLLGRITQGCTDGGQEDGVLIYLLFHDLLKDKNYLISLHVLASPGAWHWVTEQG